MYTVEKVGPYTYKAKMTISPEEWEKYVEQAYEETKDKFSVQGFRKGKVPRKVIEQNYGNNIFFDDAIDIAVSNEFEAIIAKGDIEHIIDAPQNPKFSIESFDEKGLVVNAEVLVVPSVKLGQYKGLEIEKHEHALDEKQVEKELEQVREKRARFESVDRPAKMGDIVTIDFVGSVDGKEFEGGKAENYRLELGSKSFIDNFEDQVAGMSVGEKKDVLVKFPEEYGVAELKGKDAVFAVTLNKVEEKQLPELNDEFASEVSEFETLAEYKEDIRKNLQASLDEHNKRETENNLIEAIVNGSEVELPQVLIDKQLDLFVRDFEARLSYQGMKLDDYLTWSGMTLEQLKEQRTEQAKQSVKTQLVLQELVTAEKFDVTKEELTNKFKELSEKYKKPVAEFEKMIDAKQMDYYKNELLMDKIFKFLLENNKLVEEKHAHNHDEH